MSPEPIRIVDTHVHLWDPALTDWYPYLAGQQDLGLGDVSGMARRFVWPTYQAEAAGWNVEKVVNVAAATGAHSVDETLAMEARAEADGQPAAIVGGLSFTRSIEEGVAQIERQLGASRLRGVRRMAPPGHAVPAPELLQCLVDHDLIFELLAHPNHLEAAVADLAAIDGLTVVVEHAGWLESGSAEERAVWERGLAALAALGPHVHCKLSGLSGPVGMDAAAIRPWIEPALEWFGVDRCFFASNFPVDGLAGTLDQLWAGFDEVTADLGDEARAKLFAANAEHLYRC